MPEGGKPAFSVSDHAPETARRSNDRITPPHGRRPVPEHRVEDLMLGQREAVLSFGGEPYRLRITSNNKLILTK